MDSTTHHQFLALPSSLISLLAFLSSLLSEMAHSELTHDRQFHVDPVTAQTFFREHTHGVWGMWRPLEPSDFHPPRPATHNVGVLMDLCFMLITNPSHAYCRLSRVTRKILWLPLIPPYNDLSLLPQLSRL